MQTCGPLLDQPKLLHDHLSMIIEIDPLFLRTILQTEKSRFPENEDAFLIAFRECSAGFALTANSKFLDDDAIKAAFPAVRDSFNRRTEYRRMPGIGKSGAECLDIFMGSDIVPSHSLLEQLSARHACDAQSLCEDISELTGFRPVTIARILIRAIDDGLIDPKTGHQPIPKVTPRVLDMPVQHSLFEPVQIDLFKI